MNYQILQGDNIESIKELEDNSIDSIVTDPPYGLSFMGKKWDYDVPGVEIWQECLRVLKPGGFLLSFAGTRTQHRMAVNIEDAGFEIRDMIAWVYGSGFPKSHNISKAIDKMEGVEHPKNTPVSDNGSMSGANYTREKMDVQSDLAKAHEGWGTALKPALEPITVARKPITMTVANNVLKYGTGGINIDGCRVEYQGEADKESATPQGKCTANLSVGSAPDVDMSEVDYHGEKYWYKNEYRWLIDKWLNDEDYVWSELKQNIEIYDWCEVPNIAENDRILLDSVECVCIRLYESKRKEFERPKQTGRFPANFIHDGSEEVVSLFPNTKGGKRNNTAIRKEDSTSFGGKEGQKFSRNEINDSGSAARYFYCAKASNKDRNEGMEAFEFQKTSDGREKEADNAFQRGKTLRANFHPTVKPTDLMQYLVRLVTPVNGTVLDPFMGSGSTGKACMYEHFNFIGMELDEEYCKIAEARIEFAQEEEQQIDIFDIIEGD